MSDIGWGKFVLVISEGDLFLVKMTISNNNELSLDLRRLLPKNAHPIKTNSLTTKRQKFRPFTYKVFPEENRNSIPAHSFLIRGLGNHP